MMNKLYDDINARLFKQYGTSDSNKLLFTCTECGIKQSVDSSYSNQGRNLVCLSCFNKFYDGDIIKLHGADNE